MQTKSQKKYRIGYFAILGSLFFIANAIVTLINYMGWMDANMKVSFLILTSVTIVFAFSAVLFNFFRRSWDQKEGFFFLIASVCKLIVSSLLLFFVIQNNMQYKHEIAVFFISYYFLLLFYDTFYQIRILKENESLS